ncbi:MAG: cysteine--tRNA ligase [Candidatus Omnitrophota bacterium]
MIKIYNTLTRQKEEFRPMVEGKVGMYVCGPTVYDVPHIGHARSAHVFDVIRRYFEYAGLDVHFVRNVTDIDDKIIKKANDELRDIGENAGSSRLRERAMEVADRYLRVYHHQLDVLGVRPPTEEPKATENINGMIDFIRVLVDKGYAYAAAGDVYFSVEKFEGYGKLSNQDKEQMMHGSRIEPDPKKRQALDFVLWKTAKPSEPFWVSPWGKGRPGWHIECSVMSTSILGPRFDIHGGGLDLIFPHHENEIAQAEAATGTTFADYWIHNGLLTVNGEKMSKSLGNFITIEDFLARHEDPDLLKIAFLNSLYRSPMDYSDEKIAEARRTKERIMILLDKIDRMGISPGEGEGSDRLSADAIVKAQEAVHVLRERFDEAMNDDFNTPQAMAVIFEAVKLGNDCVSDKSASAQERAHMASAIKNYILRFSDILGLSLCPVKMDEGFEAEVAKIVALREEARRRKDYKKADVLRKELMEKGVVVEDTPEGAVWRKI